MAILYTIQPTDNIQNALDLLNTKGGGILSLNPTDIFYPFLDINIPSNCTINGNGGTIDFGGSAFGIKVIGTVDTNIINPSFEYVTIQNTTGIGIDLNYMSSINFETFNDVVVQDCGKGIRVQNSYAPYFFGTFQNNGVNVEMDTVNSFEIHFSGLNGSTSGDGLVLNNCSSSTILDSGFDSNFANGIKMTNCTNIDIYAFDASLNGGDGLKFVSGNTLNVISGGNIASNTGWGINIVDATTTKTIFTGNNTASNSSGGLQDNGTGTLKSSTVNNFL